MRRAPSKTAEETTVHLLSFSSKLCLTDENRPVRGPSPLAHGPQGGANLQISNGEEVDVDADGEDDDPGHKRSAAAVADDDDGDDDGDLEDSGEKRRRVEVAGYDDYV